MWASTAEGTPSDSTHSELSTKGCICTVCVPLLEEKDLFARHVHQDTDDTAPAQVTTHENNTENIELVTSVHTATHNHTHKHTHTHTERVCVRESSRM